MDFKFFTLLSILTLSSGFSGIAVNPAYAGGGFYGENLYPWDKPGFTDLGNFTWGYESCLPGMNCSVKMQRDGKTYYYRDGNGYDIKNCTSYAVWKAKSVFGNGLNINNLGNATLWDNKLAERGFKIRPAGELPEVGDIAQDEGSDGNPNAEPGHVGYVEDVYADSGGKYYIVVSEYNRKTHGEYSLNGYSRDTDGNFWRHTDQEPKTKKWDKFIDINGSASAPVVTRPPLPNIPTVKSISNSIPKLNLQSPIVNLQGYKPVITVPRLQGSKLK